MMKSAQDFAPAFADFLGCIRSGLLRKMAGEGKGGGFCAREISKRYDLNE
jgi:hypothetical protein